MSNIFTPPNVHDILSGNFSMVGASKPAQYNAVCELASGLENHATTESEAANIGRFMHELSSVACVVMWARLQWMADTNVGLQNLLNVCPHVQMLMLEIGDGPENDEELKDYMQLRQIDLPKRISDVEWLEFKLEALRKLGYIS